MNKNPKTGDIVIFFFIESELHFNNGGKIAPAIVVGRPWVKGGGTLQLKVFVDGIDDRWASSCTHASSLKDAILGHKWATIEECESWGVDLEVRNQDSDVYRVNLETDEKSLEDMPADKDAVIEPTNESESDLPQAAE